MFAEDTDWDAPDLDSSLSEALLAKPVATPTKQTKPKNKYRPNSKGRKRGELVPHDENTPKKRKAVPHNDNTPLMKRARVKSGKKKHVKCSVFDSVDNWNDVITQHEEEDPTNENLAKYIQNVVEDIGKENKAAVVTDTKKEKKLKKKKRKSVHFDEANKADASFTNGTSSAMSTLNIDGDSAAESTESTTSSMKFAKEKLTKIKGKFQKKMDASQFRFINEKLYTTTGTEAADMFSKKPELFEAYHRGFSNQVEKWDVNPVDKIIKFLQKRNRQQDVIADFGCGEAKIAQTLPNPVFSFDLVKVNPHVIVANISDVPLGDSSCDVAVFCLSLMGTDFKQFIREARRVLKTSGTLCIAEVASRIADVDQFVTGIEELGFRCTKKDLQNSYFVNLRFRKVDPKENKGHFEQLSLKPCTYKKR